MEPAQKLSLTEDEYLERERHAETKSEYIHGEIIAMAGGTPRHSLIAANVVFALRSRLQRPCLVFQSDLRINVAATHLYTYPDVSVVCARPEFHPKDPNTLLNPKLLVEVLSDSTAGYDRGAKFAHYRNLPSIEEYLLVSHGEPHVEHYRKIEPRTWVLTDFYGDAQVVLPSLGLELPLAELYANVDLLDESAAGR